jgi:outer membrane protein TolC
VGLNFTWNLFDGLASQAKAKAGIEQKIQAEQTLRQQRLKARQDFEFWKKKYTYFSAVNKFRLSDVEKATESVRLAKEGRRVGARTNTDLLDAETELYRAKAGVVNSQVGALEALVNLELTIGVRLLK